MVEGWDCKGLIGLAKPLYNFDVWAVHDEGISTSIKLIDTAGIREGIHPTRNVGLGFATEGVSVDRMTICRVDFARMVEGSRPRVAKRRLRSASLLYFKR